MPDTLSKVTGSLNTTSYVMVETLVGLDDVVVKEIIVGDVSSASLEIVRVKSASGFSAGSVTVPADAAYVTAGVSVSIMALFRFRVMVFPDTTIEVIPD